MSQLLPNSALVFHSTAHPLNTLCCKIVLLLLSLLPRKQSWVWVGGLQVPQREPQIPHPLEGYSSVYTHYVATALLQYLGTKSNLRKESVTYS